MYSKAPNIVVLLLTYKRQDKTVACLSELLSHNDIPFRVLVWNNGSQDDTLSVVAKSFPDVLTHYRERNLGVADGRNASAQKAMREIGAAHLLFLDNDILVESGFVGALYEPFETEPQPDKRQPNAFHARSQSDQ